MTTTHITQEQLAELLRNADVVTTLQTNSGDYSAVVCVDGKFLDVHSKALDPTAQAQIREISEAEAQRLIGTDFRTVRRY